MSWLMATIYDRFMAQMERASGDAWRRELMAKLHGDVLEIGAGTGRNLEFYPRLARLVLAEPDVHMRRRLEAAIDPAKPAEIVSWSADALACADASFDAVVSTLVLCSVPDPAACLAEIRRVLRPGGKLVFLEHVVSPKESRRRWQRRVEPLWKPLADGCHLCRDTEASIRDAGFSIATIERESARKALPILRHMIRGTALN